MSMNRAKRGITLRRKWQCRFPRPDRGIRTFEFQYYAQIIVPLFQRRTAETIGLSSFFTYGAADYFCRSSSGTSGWCRRNQQFLPVPPIAKTIARLAAKVPILRTRFISLVFMFFPPFIFLCYCSGNKE